MTKEEALRLAAKYAPVFAQKVDKEWILADQIAPVDFDGLITNCSKNIDKLFKLPHDDREYTKPKVYFSFCETTTHYFVLYAVYHVLDWWKRLPPDNLYDMIRDSLDEHVHDMEGALLIITRKHDPNEERVDAIITVAHNHFYLYSEPLFPPRGDEKEPRSIGKPLYVAKFNETVDGHIWLDPESQRVKLYVQAKGHGIYGDHTQWGGGDEIWYYVPKGVLSDPRLEKMPKLENVRDPRRARKSEITVLKPYDLEDIFSLNPKGLWHYKEEPLVFQQKKEGKKGAWGFVFENVKKNRELEPGSANPPWSWNDCNDTSPMGEIATDPAHLIIRYAQGWGPVSTQYIYNPYQSIRD